MLRLLAGAASGGSGSGGSITTDPDWQAGGMGGTAGVAAQTPADCFRSTLMRPARRPRRRQLCSDGLAATGIRRCALSGQAGRRLVRQDTVADEGRAAAGTDCGFPP